MHDRRVPCTVYIVLCVIFGISGLSGSLEPHIEALQVGLCLGYELDTVKAASNLNEGVKVLQGTAKAFSNTPNSCLQRLCPDM